VLTSNPNITIELSAHTDFIGDNESNKILSENGLNQSSIILLQQEFRRKDFHRLDMVRKTFCGRCGNCSEISFLKENDVLDEAFVTKLSPDLQEIANQINRRTEFRVVKTTYK